MLPGSSSGSNVQMDLRLEYTPRIAASPERHPIPGDRVTAPSSTHTSALAIPGERTGVAAKLGDRQFFKVALPETASSHNFSFRLSGRSLDSGQSERQFKSPCLFFYAFPPPFLLLYGSSNPPVCFFIFAFFCSCRTYEYCCCTVVRAWVRRGCSMNFSFSVLHSCTRHNILLYCCIKSTG